MTGRLHRDRSVEPVQVKQTTGRILEPRRIGIYCSVPPHLASVVFVDIRLKL